MNSFLPDNILGWLSFFVMVIGGSLSLFYTFSNIKKQNDKENNDLEESLKRNYKERVEQLEKQTTQQFLLIKEMEKRITELETANKVLSDTLGGVGEESLRFRKEGFEAMKKIVDMENKLSTLQNNGEKVLQNIERLFVIIEKHLENETVIIGNIKA